MMWGALWRSDNALDGKREFLLYEKCMPCLFRTRQEARDWIENRYGYFRGRDDLKDDPHGWKMPIPVKVGITRKTT